MNFSIIKNKNNININNTKGKKRIKLCLDIIVPFCFSWNVSYSVGKVDCDSASPVPGKKRKIDYRFA